MIRSKLATNILSPLALLAVAGTPALAQDSERMHEVVSADTEAGTYMGSVLVAKGDEILLNRSYGSANLEWDIANTTDTKFRLGSVTKQFTAAATLLLQQRGELDIDEPVKTYWPTAPAAWDAITVRDLLNHTSGIPNVTALDEFGTWKYLPTTREELIGRFSDLPLAFSPGENWAYSNSNYLMLTAIVEEVSGKSYADFVQTEIFDVLGMDDTGIDVSSQILDHRASGYSPSGNGIVNADYVNMAIPQGAGALYSTTGDLLKWQRGLFGGKILNDAALAEFTKPADLAAFGEAKYASGILVEELDGKTTYWHGGGIEGFNSWLGYDPESDITVVVLANLNGGNARTLGLSLMTLARGGEVELASEREEVAVAASDLAEYEGTYRIAPTFALKFWADGDQFMTQATGQNAFPVFAQGKDEFFLKVVDAKLTFNRDDDGEIVSVTLHQNGNKSTGIKE